MSQKKYKFDINVNIDTINKFIDLYDDIEIKEPKRKKIKLDNDNSDECDDNDEYNYKKFYKIIEIVLDKEKWLKIDSKDNDNFMFNNKKKYSLGNTINITYCPASQKYIDYYDDEAFTGTIFFVDNDQDNMLLYINNNDNTITVKSLEREGCHYLGMTRGYSYCLYP